MHKMVSLHVGIISKIIELDLLLVLIYRKLRYIKLPGLKNINPSFSAGRVAESFLREK